MDMKELCFRQTTSEIEERQKESNKNLRNAKKSSTKRKVNNDKRLKEEIIDLSSDVDSEFSPKNTKCRPKTNIKRQMKSKISDDESSSDSRRKQKPNGRLRKPKKKMVKDTQRNDLPPKQRTLNRVDSTSSEKEFSKHKIIESYVCLQRVNNIEKDRTTSVDENKFDEDKSLTKNEAFLLKNNLQKLFQDLQNISTKLIYEIEHTRKTYYYKEHIRLSDATKAIIECKNILRNLKEKTNNCEKLLVDRYNNWCKKTNNVNLFINNDGPDTPKRWKTPTIHDTNKVVFASSSSDSETELSAKAKKSTTNVKSSSLNDGQKVSTQVSDCDGQQIFSADEMEKETDTVNLDEIIIDPTIKQKLGEKSINVKIREKEREDNRRSSDSDTTIVEKDLSTVSSKNQENEKTVKAFHEAELDESGDLFSDFDVSGNEISSSIDLLSNCNSKMITHRSDSERVGKNEESNSHKNDVHNREDKTLPSTKLKASKCLENLSTDEDDNTEKQIEERLLNSSPDSDRNKPIHKNVNTRVRQLDYSSHSDENPLTIEDLNVKKKLLDSSSNSDQDESIDNDVNKKQEQLDPSPNPNEAELIEDAEIRGKLLDSSSDSDRNELENKNTNFEKKLPDCLSNSNGNTLVENQSENLLNSSISFIPKQTEASIPETSVSLSNVAEKASTSEKVHKNSMPLTSESDDGSADEDKVKKKLLDSSSDSDRDEEMNTSNKKVQKQKNETDILSVSDKNLRKETNKQDNKNIISNQETKINESTKIDSHLSNDNAKEFHLNGLNQLSIETCNKNSYRDNSHTGSNVENINNTHEQEKALISHDSSENKHIKVSKTNNDNQGKKKFAIRNNKHFQNDEKLRLKCFIKIQQLSENILSQHLHTLQSSREYLETRQFHSLVSLDHLEKKHHHGGGFVLSDEENSVQSKSKQKQLNPPKETLLDHLNKVDSNENKNQHSNSDNSDIEATSKKMNNVSFSENLIKESDAFSKARLLESSDSEVEIVVESNLPDPYDVSNTRNTTQKGTSLHTSKGSDEEDETIEKESENQLEETNKNDWKKSKVLTAKFFESDSDEENDRAQKKLAKANNKRNNSDSDKSCNEAISKKKTKRRRIVTSDDSDIKISSCSSDTDSESDQNDKRKKNSEKKSTKRRKKSDSDLDSGKETAVKTKRRRIRTVVNDSDSSDSELNSSQTSSNKGGVGRKNIRKVLKDKQVAQDTQEAAKQEEERLKRMAERQKLYNEMYETRLANEEKVDKLILDFDGESKEILLDVDKNLVKRLKPHQAKGIKFMWDACFESLKRIQNSSGSGCILAHCMGLGKSFQVVTLAHTLLTHSDKTNIKTILIVAPLSTVLNWINEFKIWLAEVENGDDIELYEMTKAKTLLERKCQLDNWHRTGGILIIGYEMFRNLSSIKGKVRQSVRDAISKSILDPGPDLIICDEGHLLKNEDSAISKAIRKVQTLRRVVLTGTPLQNNLIEYHCMVQFVKPNLLGTKREFLNRFANPIQNGQFDDSTEYDVKIMKKRAHVLHKMLEGSVQRFDYSVLTPFLPPKQEYVILVKLTDVQRQMYQYYLDNFARKQASRAGGSLFVDFQGLHRIWTHPYVMKLHAENHERLMMKKREAASDSEGSLRDFIDDNSESDSSSNKSDDSNKSDVIALDDDDKPIQRSTRANPVKEGTPPPSEEEPIEQREWWSQFVKPEYYTDARVSAKLLMLLDILKEAEQIGDKVLLFSQSLYSLTLIEKFLEMIDDETQNSNELPSLDKHTGSWSLGLDYFRLDGQTSAENRSIWVKNFNKPSNSRARLFLISTRAGGLGINLTAANRVIIFDASWNPSHDVQSIFRIYRFGQKKPCYVYRFLAAGTMEEKIYNRQVTKLSLSCRVVDEYQIERHYSNHDLAELYRLEPSKSKPLGLPKDRLLAEIFLRHKDLVEAYHEHDSLLENIAEEELNDEERQQAWREYEEEKAGIKQTTVNINPQLMLYHNKLMDATTLSNLMNQGEHLKLLEMIKKDYPHITETAQREMAYRALNNMYSYVENRLTLQAASKVNLPTMNVPNIPNMNTTNPTMTVANMLAQQEYARAHNKHNQQQKQMQYAQQFGNTIGNSQNKAIPTTSTGKYSINNGEIIDITPNSGENITQGSSKKRKEE